MPALSVSISGASARKKLLENRTVALRRTALLPPLFRGVPAQGRIFLLGQSAQVIDHVPPVGRRQPEAKARHGRFSERDLPPQRTIRLLLNAVTRKTCRTDAELGGVGPIAMAGRSVTTGAADLVNLFAMGDRNLARADRVFGEEARRWCFPVPAARAFTSLCRRLDR